MDGSELRVGEPGHRTPYSAKRWRLLTEQTLIELSPTLWQLLSSR